MRRSLPEAYVSRSLGCCKRKLCPEPAIAVAKIQSAKFWELRIATNLDRLWQSQGKCQHAYELFASVYEWFTEGSDKADLQETKALLAELVD